MKEIDKREKEIIKKIGIGQQLIDKAFKCSDKNPDIKNCQLCGNEFGHGLMKYKFPDTKYIICHGCYGKVYDYICDTIIAQRKRDRGRVVEIINKLKRKDTITPNLDEDPLRFYLLLEDVGEDVFIAYPVAICFQEKLNTKDLVEANQR